MSHVARVARISSTLTKNAPLAHSKASKMAVLEGMYVEGDPIKADRGTDGALTFEKVPGGRRK